MENRWNHREAGTGPIEAGSLSTATRPSRPPQAEHFITSTAKTRGFPSLPRPLYGVYSHPDQSINRSDDDTTRVLQIRSCQP